MTDLKAEVVAELTGRTIAEWDAIAAAAEVSKSMIAQLGRGKYKSSPTYEKLARISQAIKQHPRQQKGA